MCLLSVWADCRSVRYDYTILTNRHTSLERTHISRLVYVNFYFLKREAPNDDDCASLFVRV